MLRHTLLLLALIRSMAVPEDDGHAGHDHGSAKAWEWVGVFDFHDYSTANFVLSVKEGKDYPDKTVDILMLATKTGDAAGIEAIEDEAKHKFKNVSTFINVAVYDDKIISPDTVHRLTLGSGPISPYRLGNFMEDENHKATYALFVQHFPTEFEGMGGHYLKSNKGKDIEPSATEPASKATAKGGTSEHAGQAIGASIIVTLLGAIGLFVVYPCWNGLGKNKNCILFANDIAQCFASGALLSTSFFLIFPEAMYHFKKAHPTDDVLQTVGFGSTTLTGIVLSMSISMLCNALGTPDINTASKEKNIELIDVEKVDKNKDQVDVNQTSLPNKPFCQCRPSEWTGAAWTVLVGDFFHNVADGIAIGVAFRTCDPLFGWVVAIGAIGHEVTQEIADFCLLISRGNMSVGAAVSANLLSGVSCIIGAVVASYVEMSEEAVAGLLAFSGGVYLWAAMCECVAPLIKETNGVSIILLRIFMFVVGVVCIGLVLLNHVHCEKPVAPGEVDPHAGHNH